MSTAATGFGGGAASSIGGVHHERGAVGVGARDRSWAPKGQGAHAHRRLLVGALVQFEVRVEDAQHGRGVLARLDGRPRAAV